MLAPRLLRRAGGRRRRLSIEPLENRLYLSGLAIAPAPAGPRANAATPSTPPAILQNPAATVQTLTTGDFSQAVQSINDFALNLYQNFQQQSGNLFLSPMSIATALAMTYAGARGQTASQMADVLDLGQPSTVAASYHALLGMLQSSSGSELSVANALWPQAGYAIENSFLQLIKSEYGGSAQSLNYISQAEAARQTINAWVSQQTDGKITNLIPEGVLTAATRLVLTDAVYFNGQWATQFDPSQTTNQPFELASGKSVDTPMMYSDSQYAYSVQDGYQVLDLPYRGGKTSMVVLLPQNTTAVTDVSSSTLTKVNDWLDTDPGTQEAIVRLPKFQMTVSSSLNEVLAGMGMPLAFNKAQADFSGIAPPTEGGNLYIQQVLHKAYIEVDEQGTQAAGATGVVVGAFCQAFNPTAPVVFTADHSFQYYIRDNQTGTILFMGRMTDPSQTENSVTPTAGAAQTSGTSTGTTAKPIATTARSTVFGRPPQFACGPYLPWEVSTATTAALASANSASTVTSPVSPAASGSACSLATVAALNNSAAADSFGGVDDLTIVLTNYGQTGAVWSQGDTQGDTQSGTVAINDLKIVLANFGDTADSAQSADSSP
jgi:serpin B